MNKDTLFHTQPDFPADPPEKTPLPPWFEVVADLMTNALDVLSSEELREIFDDLETSYPDLPKGSLHELVSEFESLPVLTRITPWFDERKFVSEWAKKRGIPTESPNPRTCDS